MGKTIPLSDIIDFIALGEAVSTSALQRHFRIGYAYAAQIVEYLEKEGAVHRSENDPRPKLDHARLEALRRHEDHVFHSPAEGRSAKRMPAGRSTPYTFSLGVSDRGRPVTADVAKVAHLLISGAAYDLVVRRCHAVHDALMQNAPADTAYYWIAPGQDAEQYRAAWQLETPVYTEKATVGKCLSDLCRQMETFFEYVRSHGNDFAQNAPRFHTFVFVDCQTTALLSVKAKRLLWFLIVKGRAAGIHVVLATTSKKSVLCDMIPSRIVCRTENRTASFALLGRPNAETLADNEFFYLAMIGKTPIKIVG